MEADSASLPAADSPEPTATGVVAAAPEDTAAATPEAAEDGGAADDDDPPPRGLIKRRSSSLDASAAPFIPSSMLVKPADASATLQLQPAEHSSQGVRPADMSAELCQAIVRQVEHYFSDDERLSNDKFLIGRMRQHIGHDEDGNEVHWVPISVVGSFNKMKKLLPQKDHRVACIAAALQSSAVMQVDAGGKLLARRCPFRLPELAEKAEKAAEDVRQRTVEATNLPAGATQASLTELFSRCGKVESVSFYPTGDTRSHHGERPAGADGGRAFAVCVYAAAASAARAHKELSDTSNWRGGLRVALPRGVKPLPPQRGSKAGHEQQAAAAAAASAAAAATPDSAGARKAARKRSDSVPSAAAAAASGYASPPEPSRMRAMSNSHSPAQGEAKAARRKPRAASIALSELAGTNSAAVGHNTSRSPRMAGAPEHPPRGSPPPQGRLYVGVVQSTDGGSGGSGDAADTSSPAGGRSTRKKSRAGSAANMREALAGGDGDGGSGAEAGGAGGSSGGGGGGGAEAGVDALSALANAEVVGGAGGAAFTAIGGSRRSSSGGSGGPAGPGGAATGGVIKGGNARRTKLAFQAVDVEGPAVEKGDLVRYRAWRNESGQWVALQVRKITEEEAARLSAMMQPGELPPTPSNARSSIGGGGSNPGTGNNTPLHPRSPARRRTSAEHPPVAPYRTDKATQRHFRMAAGPSDAMGSGFPAGRGKPLQQQQQAPQVLGGEAAAASADGAAAAAASADGAAAAAAAAARALLEGVSSRLSPDQFDDAEQDA
ncbi:hypothetical protein JKP88DRAFT_323981 [Tribonema minus]|uniref:HTH La-type RNA-binding domain-containing protein n=1 Tax=Tribonema minus TaxID=303371 RepID=A0A836CCB1_9STRA|nr:hypothetical protein JKP88DRAFT_323981 [Tribonema minus]